MSLSSVLEGEGRLLGVIGTNAALGGVQVADKTVGFFHRIMPCLPDALLVVQVLVGLATLVYMLLKIRRIWLKKD